MRPAAVQAERPPPNSLPRRVERGDSGNVASWARREPAERHPSSGKALLAASHHPSIKGAQCAPGCLHQRRARTHRRARSSSDNPLAALPGGCETCDCTGYDELRGDAASGVSSQFSTQHAQVTRQTNQQTRRCSTVQSRCNLGTATEPLPSEASWDQDWTDKLSSYAPREDNRGPACSDAPSTCESFVPERR